jgi:catecholate siderophore receptor
MTNHLRTGSSPPQKAGKNTAKNRNKKRACWPEVYKWLAAGTLVVYTAVGSKTVSLAQAQDAAGAPNPSGSQAQALLVRQFDIPAGPLDGVLRSFGDATELQIELTNPAIRTIQSPGVSGTYTNTQALQQILRDTGVASRFTSTGAVILELAAVATSIEVTATAAEPTSPKYTAPLREIPQTISIIPKNVIEQQGATTLTDVLRNVPGLTVMAGEGGQPAGDNLVLRGFSARNDIFVDGVRDLGPQSRDPFNLEQVEVFKGPQSAFTGRGSTGGSINMVSKTPSVNRMFGGSLSLGTASMQRGTGDVNLPLGDRTAFRLNVMGHDAGVPGRDVVENERWGVAPGLAFGLGTPTTLTLGYSKLKQSNISDYGIPWVPASNNVLVEYRDKPAPVPRETFYGFRSRDRERMNSDMATVRLEHDFTDSFTLRNQFRYGRSTRDSMATPPRFASPDSTNINREMRSWITEDGVYDNQTDLTADFATGAIRHTVVTGVSFTKENNIRQLRTAPNSPTTLLNPNPDDIYGGEITLNPNLGDIDASTKAVYAFDTVRLGRRWQVNAGLRSENFDVEGITTAAQPLSHSEHMLSLRTGVVFSPRSNGSIYTSYGSSLNPSLEGLSYGANNIDPNLDPEKTYTTELGTKWDLFQNRLMLSSAVFQVIKHNARTPGILPDDPPQVLDGKQRVRGVELGATGYIRPEWMVFGGYTYLDSQITESNNPNELGNVFPQTPDHSFNLWTTYSFPWRVTLGGGVRYVGRRYNNTSNARFVDGYSTVDAMASFPVSRNLDVRLNLNNLTNEYYFERVGGGHVIPGAGRSAMVSTVFHF